MAIVVPSKDSSVTTFLVDDYFGNAIAYSGSWDLLGAIEEFGFTTHGTDEPGATATFTFYGTKVDVFGTLNQANNETLSLGPPVSGYSLDGGPETLYTAPNNTDTLRSVLFYESSPLSDNGPHILKITYKAGRTFFLDYIHYTIPVQDTVQTSTDTSSISPTSSMICPSQTSSSSLTSQTPVLIGAVLGAFFVGVILTALASFLFYRRHHRRSDLAPSMWQPVPFAAPTSELTGSVYISTQSGIVEHGSDFNLVNASQPEPPPVYSKRRG